MDSLKEMTDEEDKKTFEYIKQDVRILKSEEPASRILKEVMADLIERDERHHPERSDEERVKQAKEDLKKALWLLVIDP